MHSVDASPSSRKRRGVVLFAAPYTPQPDGSFLRAAAHARALGLNLVVLRALPRVTAGDPVFPQRQTDHALRLLRLERVVAAATRRWCRRLLAGSSAAAVEVRVGRGDCAELILEVCQDDEVRLIVVPRAPQFSGRWVEDVALEARCPVLVAEQVASTDALVAASDLEDGRFPVLNYAQQLAERFHAPAVFVHNLAPMVLHSPVGAAGGAPRVLDPSPAELEARRRMMESLAATIDAAARVRVEHHLDAATAVLTAATVADADLVVVGARPRPWAQRVTRASVTTRVVDQSDRSVLVLPMASADPGLLGAHR